MEAVQITKQRRHKNDIMSGNGSFLCFTTNIVLFKTTAKLYQLVLPAARDCAAIGLAGTMAFTFFKYSYRESYKCDVFSFLI